MRPEVSTAAEEIYTFLSPFVEEDESTDWTTLLWCEAIAGGVLQRIHGWVTDQDGRPGYAVLVDAQTVETVGLPWLSQLNGTVLVPSMTEQERRDAIENPSGFARGTPDAFEAAPLPFLTGTKKVYVEERYEGEGYKVRVRVLKWETPSETLVEAALLRQKPAGLVMTFEVIEGQQWNDVDAKFATWNAVKAEYANWDDMRIDVP